LSRQGGRQRGHPATDDDAVVTLTEAPSTATSGYRLVAGDGGIINFGDRIFHGSTGDIVLNQPIVGGATDLFDLDGYWIVASDGGVFAFDDIPLHESMGGTKLNSPPFDRHDQLSHLTSTPWPSPRPVGHNRAVVAIRYVKSAGMPVAYEVVGAGPKDIVYLPGAWGQLEVRWEEPSSPT
jgi:hypothetical protein